MEKKIWTNLIVSMIVISCFVIAINSVSATPQPHVIKGKVYINGKEALASKNNTYVALEMPSFSKTSFILDEAGNYNIGFSGYGGKTANISVNYKDKIYYPEVNSSVDIEISKTIYLKNLYIVFDESPGEQIPYSPNPNNNTEDASIDITLSFKCSTSDNETTYDIYFGKNSNPKFVINTDDTEYDPGSLDYGTTYYWKIISIDSNGNETIGDIWSFTTLTKSSIGIPDANFSISGNKEVDSIITFDATDSSDPEDQNLSFRWKFSPSSNFSDWSDNKKITYTYKKADNYDVTLQVKDTDENIDSTSKTININPKQKQNENDDNKKPTTPIINAEKYGKAGETISISFKSTDPDKDKIKYVVKWGDSEKDELGPFSSGTKRSMEHSYAFYNDYEITVVAIDEHGLSSDEAKHIIYISMIEVSNIGFLIDNDYDGKYDEFKNSTTNEKHDVEEDSDGQYLIDENGDGNFDKSFNVDQGKLEEYSKSDSDGGILGIFSNPIVIIVLVAVLIWVVTMAIIIISKRKKKQEEQIPDTLSDSSSDSFFYKREISENKPKKAPSTVTSLFSKKDTWNFDDD